MFKRIILVLSSLALVACGGTVATSPYATNSARLRDVIFSVENTNGKALKVWMVHDDVAFYCVKPNDQELQRDIENIFRRGNSVIIGYQTLTYSVPVSDSVSNPCGYSGRYESLRGPDYLALDAYQIVSIEELTDTLHLSK